MTKLELTVENIKKVPTDIFYNLDHYNAFLNICDKALAVNVWIETGGEVYDSQEKEINDEKFHIELYGNDVRLIRDNVMWVGDQHCLKRGKVYINSLNSELLFNETLKRATILDF